MAASDEWIKHRAYELWEQEGYPSGKDKEHWERAKLEYASQNPVASSDKAPKRKLAAEKAEKPATKALKTTAPKAATPKKAAKSEKPAPAASGLDAETVAAPKPKATKPKTIKAAAATASSEQTKKRPKKVAAE